MKQGKTLITDLTSGSVSKQLLKFAYPFMLANLLQTVYNIVDMIVIGQFVGNVGLSAVSCGGDLTLLFLYVSMGFASASQILIAQLVGSGDKEGIRKAIGTSFTFCLLLGAVVTAVVITFTPQLLRLLKTPAEALEQAKAYTITYFSGFIFAFGYNLVASILRGMGDSKHPLMFMLIASVSNMVLDLLFVAVFKWDAFGAGLATMMGLAISFICSLVFLYKRREDFGFDFKRSSFRMDGRSLRAIVRLGIPLAVQHVAITVSMLFISAYVNSYGVVASAVTGVGNKLRSVMSIISNAIATAGAAMVAQNMGAGKPDRVKKIVKTSLAVCLSVAAVLSILFLTIPKVMFSIFDTDPDFLDMAPVYGRVLVVFFVTFALMAPFNTVINGVGNVFLSYLTGILDGVVARVGAAILLGIVLEWGIEGFWYGSAGAGLFTAAVGFIYYISGKWKTHKLLID